MLPNRGVVLVIYRDSWFEFDESADGERKDYLNQLVGWVVKDDGGWLTVASERLPYGDGYRAISHIPQGNVIHKHSLYPSRHPHADPLG